MDTLKICSKCLVKKDISEFYCRKTGKRAGEYYEKCIVCMRKRAKKYYFDNHKRQLELALKRRKKAYLYKREYINKVKNVPCKDCGKRYPSYVMDFDHKRGSDKLSEIGNLSSKNWSLDKIKTEIKKCDIVCANCHRIRTYKKAEVAKSVTAGL